MAMWRPNPKVTSEPIFIGQGIITVIVDLGVDTITVIIGIATTLDIEEGVESIVGMDTGIVIDIGITTGTKWGEGLRGWGVEE